MEKDIKGRGANVELMLHTASIHTFSLKSKSVLHKHQHIYQST
jgi:hypothetical protein